MAIIDGKLIVVDPGGFAEGRSVSEHPGLEIVSPVAPAKVNKKKRTDHGSKTDTKSLRE